jgi:hypothetical protein
MRTKGLHIYKVSQNNYITSQLFAFPLFGYQWWVLWIFPITTHGWNFCTIVLFGIVVVCIWGVINKESNYKQGVLGTTTRLLSFGPHRKLRFQQIPLCLRNVFTELLPSNDRHIHRQKQKQKQKLTAGNQPARSILAPGPVGTHGHIFVQCQDLCFVLFFLSLILLIDKGGVGLLYIYIY